MLFTEYSKRYILSGDKTQTRRFWKRKPPKEGSVVFAETQLFKKEARFARIKILSVKEWDGVNISIADVMAEGFLDKTQYLTEYNRLNKGKLDDKDRTHYVIDFEVVERL